MIRLLIKLFEKCELPPSDHTNHSKEIFDSATKSTTTSSKRCYIFLFLGTKTPILLVYRLNRF